MTELQTAENFEKNLNTTFRLQMETPQPIDLTLAEVAVRPSEPNEQDGMARFSVMFFGPPEFCLPQQMYRLAHPEMGEFDVFLVPIGKEEKGFNYEAVYNYYKEK